MIFKKYIIKFFSKKHIRDYQIFKKYYKDNLNSNRNIKLTEAILKTKFYNNNFLEKFYFRGKDNLNNIIIQFIVSKHFLYSVNKKYILGLHKNVIIIININLYKNLKNFLKINKYFSYFYFGIFVFQNFLIGVVYFFYRILHYASNLFSRKIYLNNSNFFLTLRNNSSIKPNKSYHNVFSWYKKNICEKGDDEYFFHSIKKFNQYDKQIKFINSATNIYGFNNFIYFLIFGIILIVISFFSMLLLRWKLPLLLKEILSEIILKKTPKKFLFKNYYFDNSSWLFRPLWTYEVEKKGSKVILFFYAMNIENIYKDDSLIHKSDNFWEICTWKNYYVWNEEHKKIINNFINDKNINVEIKNPISFSDCESEIKIDKLKKNIAIFDISLHRRSKSIYWRGWDFNFFKVLVVKKFYKDILNICENKNINLYFKSKKSVENKNLDKEYINFIKSIQNKKNVNIVDPNCSAFKLADLCDASISLPFTSTSQIFRYFKKPSIYYDPIKLFKKNHLGARGVELLYKSDLIKWINTLTNSKN